MSAFRGGGVKHGDGRYRELPLIQMVEEYLMQNSHQYFVNVEQMGDYIRKKSFRFARMKLPVFRERLKKAYAQYATAKTEAQNEFSGADIEMDNGPLNEETLRQMEGDPSMSDESDTGLEIEMDAGANQMKNLYATGPRPSNPATPSKSIGPNISATSELAFDQDECISVSSGTSTNSPTKKAKPTNAVVDSANSNRNDGDAEDDGSGSDLEIIEEVAPSVETVIVSTAGSVIKSIPGPSSMNTKNAAQNGSGNRVSNASIQKPGPASRTYMRGPKPQSNGDAQSLGDSRGVKRKTARSNADNSMSGIDEDFTRKRPKKEIAVVQDTGYKLTDFAGSEKVVEEVCKLLMHLKHPEIYRTLGVTPPRGFLLHGPPGTGKTLLANAIAGELGMPMLKIAGTELVSGISGESESNIRELFNQAVAAAPCIIFIDEIDSVTPKRENVNKEMERRIVAQLLACVDDLGNKEKGDQVLLIGATNRVEAIDTALRRAGRFDREICLGIPDENSREKILSVICRNLRLESGFKISSLARLTPGYVGADLQALVREAAVQAVNRKITIEKRNKKDGLVSSTGKDDEMETEKLVTDGCGSDNEKPSDSLSENQLKIVNVESSAEITQIESNNVQEDRSPLSWIKGTSPLTDEELQDLFVTMKDFEFALKHVQPSSKREGFATVPDTTWDDIGALKDIRDELQVSILGPVKHAEAFRKLGLTTPAGVLLCGPPGCGKTLLAKAVANEAGINFISVKGPELLNMYVGESERAVRQCFLRARNSSPCVIFFDELDALCPRRSEIADSGSGGRVVNQLLTEMDGMESRQGVFIMAATNRPDIIDPAILRPGRLDKILFVNLPTPEDRCEILKALTKKSVLSEDVNLEEIALSSECEDYTGADLSALVREASIAAFRDLVLHNPDGPCNDLKVHLRHFTTAFTKTKPSVSKDDRAKYAKMAAKYSTIQ